MNISTIEPTASAANSHDNVVEVLETLKDSYHGYRECADKAKDHDFKIRCADLALKRKQMFNELKSVANYMGDLSLPEKDEPSGSVAAVFHRIYVDLKALITRGDAEAIAEEIHRGEQVLLNTYAECLEKADLSLTVRDLLVNQQTEIRRDVAGIDVEVLRHAA